MQIFDSMHLKETMSVLAGGKVPRSWCVQKGIEIHTAPDAMLYDHGFLQAYLKL